MRRSVLSVFLILCFFAIYGCSGGGGGNSGAGIPVANNGLPPDPGEAGKATLEGIDSDGDGVRDDVQRHIMLTYPDEPTRRALVQLAKAEQSFLISAHDKAKALNSASERSRAMECIFFVQPDEAVEILRRMRAELLNTELRIRASIAADSLLGGETFPSVSIEERSSSCR
ncbi:MAG: hypothetical protein ACE5HN_03645 [Nitrospiria bacterium]